MTPTRVSQAGLPSEKLLLTFEAELNGRLVTGVVHAALPCVATVLSCLSGPH